MRRRGGAKKMQPGGREGEGREEGGGERIQAFLLPSDLVLSGSLLRIVSSGNSWGPIRTSRFSLPPPLQPQYKGQASSRCSILTWENKKCAQLCSGNFSPVFSPLLRRSRGQGRSWEHAQAPHE